MMGDEFVFRDKSEWLEGILIANKSEDYYPEALLDELLSTTLETSERMYNALHRNQSVEFDTIWEDFLKPYVHLLILNRQFARILKVNSVGEAFSQLQERGITQKLQNVEFACQAYIEALFDDYGVDNNLSEIFTMIRSSH